MVGTLTFAQTRQPKRDSSEQQSTKELSGQTPGNTISLNGRHLNLFKRTFLITDSFKKPILQNSDDKTRPTFLKA